MCAFHWRIFCLSLHIQASKSASRIEVQSSISFRGISYGPLFEGTRIGSCIGWIVVEGQLRLE